MNIDFTGKFKEECKEGFWTLNKKLCVGLGIIAVAALLFNVTGCTNNTQDETVEVFEEIQKEPINTENDGVSAAIAPDEDKPLDRPSTAMVAMSVEDTGRADPFLPYNEKSLSSTKLRGGLDLLPPPEAIIVDSSAVDVVETKVSGIMYDNYNPSAILKIKGSDYLVRSGDIINGYKILAIARDNVTVQNGANVFKAGVGGVFPAGSVNFNTVSNLESKFGGKNNVVRR